MESVTGHVSWKLEWSIRGWWLASFLMAGSTREGVDIRWDEWNRLWPQAVLPPLPPCQCVRTRINRRNQSRSSIGLRESPLSPWSQFNPGGLSNTGSQRPHDYPTSRELSAFSLFFSLARFPPFRLLRSRGVDRADTLHARQRVSTNSFLQNEYLAVR